MKKWCALCSGPGRRRPGTRPRGAEARGVHRRIGLVALGRPLRSWRSRRRSRASSRSPAVPAGDGVGEVGPQRRRRRERRMRRQRRLVCRTLWCDRRRRLGPVDGDGAAADRERAAVGFVDGGLGGGARLEGHERTPGAPRESDARDAAKRVERVDEVGLLRLGVDAADPHRRHRRVRRRRGALGRRQRASNISLRQVVLARDAFADLLVAVPRHRRAQGLADLDRHRRHRLEGPFAFERLDERLAVFGVARGEFGELELAAAGSERARLLGDARARAGEPERAEFR
mmetsp:Transcript_24777/g.98358  ORF Transcript_24777/g.98358 Transcript_24777/m.98358 type:complete len:287 (-) Transcript_24777:636-1496(-)